MKTNQILLFIISTIFFSCGNHYSMEDYQLVEKIDAHFHVYNTQGLSILQAQKDGFKILSINTHTGSCDRVVDTHQNLGNLHAKHPNKLEYTATFCLAGWDNPGWTENTISWIDQCISDGAIAVKIWKNIGMEFRNTNEQLIMVDNPQFDAVFAHLAEKKIPLVAHLGEPKNCWLPLAEMTTKNDSSYFANNRQYHMNKHPELPTYEDQIAARDRMLDKHPSLIFIGCHLASLEWSVDSLSQWLDKYPNAAVDLSARMGQLFYQTRENREKVRAFFIQYQNRIIYGTDIIDGGKDKKKLHKQMHETWLRDWEYLCTKNKMNSDLIDGEFRGLQLPKEIIHKIYAENASHWYSAFR